MAKYRIVKLTTANGSEKYVPQVKTFIFWRSIVTHGLFSDFTAHSSLLNAQQVIARHKATRLVKSEVV